MNDLPKRIAVAMLLLAMGGATVAVHVDYMYKHMLTGKEYLHKNQLSRHLRVIEGDARGQWQYRVLSEYVVWIGRKIGATLQRDNVAEVFIVIRVLYTWACLLLAWRYYRMLEFSEPACLLGVGWLVWAMSHSVFDSDISLNTYGDLIFYLLAMVLILKQRDAWIIPVTFLAVLNRETALLIPLLLGAARMADHRESNQSLRTTVWTVIAALAAGAAAYAAVRLWYGPTQREFVPPGLAYLTFNLKRPQTYLYLALTLNVLPVLAWIGWRQTARMVRYIGLIMLPVWVLVHMFISAWAETRLLLVPLSVVVIPAALYAVVRLGRESSGLHSASATETAGTRT